MRPTLLMFRSPKEHTPDFYQPRITNNGQPLLERRLHEYDENIRGQFKNGSSKQLYNQSTIQTQYNSSQISSTGFQSNSERFRDYQKLARNSQLGPGQYNDQESFTKMRQKSCSAKLALPTFGKAAGQPHYVYVGNQIMIDPTFLDNQTKKYFRDKQMNCSDKVYQKEFLIQELMNLSKRKYPEMKKISFMKKKRPSTQLGFNKATNGLNMNTPKNQDLAKISTSKHFMTRTNSSKQKLGLDSQRSSRKVSGTFKRPQTQIEIRQVSQTSSKYKTSPMALIEKKREILGIIKTAEKSLQESQNQEIISNSRMDRSFAQNSEYQFNSQNLPESVLVMSDIRDKNDFSTKNNKVNKATFVSRPSKQSKIVLHSGSNSTQASQIEQTSRFKNNNKYSYEQYRRLNISSQMSSTRGGRSSPESMRINNLSESNRQQLRQAHRKSNSMFQQQRVLQQRQNQEQDQACQRMREFDKSFQLLKMYASPYQQQQQISQSDKNNNFRRVNQDAVNWSTYNN